MQMSGITIETGVALGDVVDGVGRRHVQYMNLTFICPNRRHSKYCFGKDCNSHILFDFRRINYQSLTISFL